ncbi:hypothetical protein [Aliikangiella coralliicola]|uniref:Uncharacterized protein n=1 Tax=Aliikangiella coralliicola TaxID=2592383 RepID=A0A545U093_9GAMM|nr:hypothetical protein [Aliikangiella coralliicola]TQV82886.1 hypothetical protein FLL46_24255 [Aliikangiella coralliicola]
MKIPDSAIGLLAAILIALFYAGFTYPTVVIEATGSVISYTTKTKGSGFKNAEITGKRFNDWKYVMLFISFNQLRDEIDLLNSKFEDFYLNEIDGTNPSDADTEILRKYQDNLISKSQNLIYTWIGIVLFMALLIFIYIQKNKKQSK